MPILNIYHYTLLETFTTIFFKYSTTCNRCFFATPQWYLMANLVTNFNTQARKNDKGGKGLVGLHYYRAASSFIHFTFIT